jgi:hypothetical protein
MGELFSRHVPGHDWVRFGITTSRTFEPGHNSMYAGIIRRDAWRIGRLGVYLLRKPNREVDDG